MDRHGVKAIVVLNGVITRADVAEDLAEVVGVDNANVRMADIHEIKRYLAIEDESNTDTIHV